MEPKKSVESIAFDRNHILQYDGECKVQINRLSQMVFVEPKSEIAKLKSAMFTWDFYANKNILFIFAPHPLSDFALIFKDKIKCKNVFDFIVKKKTQIDVGKESFYQRFLMPLIEKLASTPINSDLIRIFAKWINNHNGEEKEEYINLLKTNNIYNIVFPIIEIDELIAVTQRNGRKRKYREMKKMQIFDFIERDGTADNITKIDSSEMQILSNDLNVDQVVEELNETANFSSLEDEITDDEDILKHFQIGDLFFSQKKENPYEILVVVDQEGCGVILQVKDENGKEFAIKVETLKQCTIIKELKIYKQLHFFGTGHIVEIIEHGVTKDKKFYYMIMPLMGENLEDFKKSQNDIKAYTIARIFQQCLLGIMDIHQSGFLHCDLKPKNILFAPPGSANRQIVYINNFGRSQPIKNVKLAAHKFAGEFACLNAHDGFQQCRADDLFCLWLTIYSLFKPLPWADSVEEESLIKSKKIFIEHSSERKEMYTKDLPAQMELLFENILSLGFHDIPNYGFLHQLINEMIETCYLPGNIRGLPKHLYSVEFDPAHEYIGPIYGSHPRQHIYYVKCQKHFSLYVNGLIARKNSKNKIKNYEHFYALSEKGVNKYRIFVQNYKKAVVGEYPDIVFFEDLTNENILQPAQSLPPSTPLENFDVELMLAGCDDQLTISELDFTQCFKKLLNDGYMLNSEKIEAALTWIQSDSKYKMHFDY